MNRNYTAALSNYFLLFVSYAILSPYLQLFLKARGLTPSEIGTLLGTMELAGVLGPLLLGRLADLRGGYRFLFAVSLVLPIAVFIPMQFASTLSVYLACISIMGFTYRSAIPLLDSLTGKILVDPARQYGRLRVAGSAGFIAISLVLQFTNVLSGRSSAAILIAFSISAVASALAVVSMPSVANEQEPKSRPSVKSSQNTIDVRFTAVIAIIFLGRFGLGAYYSFFSLYLKQTFPNSGISLFWAIGPLAEIFTIWFSGPMIKRLGLRTMFIISIGAISVRLWMFVVAPSVAFVAAAQLLHAFTFGSFHTTAVAYVNRVVSPNQRGLGMAIYSAVGIGLPTFLSSVIGGYVIEATSFSTLFLTYSAVPMMGVLAFLVFGSRILPPRDHGPGANIENLGPRSTARN